MRPKKHGHRYDKQDIYFLFYGARLYDAKCLRKRYKFNGDLQE